MAVTREVMGSCAARKATDFGSKMMLSKSSLLLRLGHLMTSCVLFKQKQPQNKKGNKAVPLLPLAERSLGESPTNMLAETKSKMCLKTDLKPNSTSKKAASEPFAGKYYVHSLLQVTVNLSQLALKQRHQNSASIFKNHFRYLRLEDFKSLSNSSRNIAFMTLILFLHLFK